MSKAINLGRKPEKLIEILGVGPGGSDSNREHYPELYLSDVDDPRLLDLPDEGKCVISYKITSRTHHEDERNGKKQRSCSLRLEIKSIEPTEGKTYNGKKKGYGDDARKSFNDYFKNNK
jgi:hypothetical protein